MTSSKATDLSDVTTDNIIKPTLKDLSEEQRRVLGEWKKKRREEIEALHREKEREDEESFMASFKLDRQGTTAPIKEPEYVPLNLNTDTPSVSNSIFSPEQIAEIQYHVSQGTNTVYHAVQELEKAKKNTTQNQTSVIPPMSPNRENRIVNALPCPTPIRTAPYSAGPAVQFPSREPMPNLNSAPWIQSGPAINHAPGPSQPTNIDDLMVEFNKKLEQVAYDRLGVRLKPRTYTKPYPDYFDLQPYPPGYRVPEFSKFNGVDNKSTWEHISQYLAQLGEANHENIKVRLFSLSLTEVADFQSSG